GLRHLAQGVERRVEARRLAGHHLQDARVLHRHAGHRTELLERRDVVLAEARGAAAAEAQRADDSGLAADWRQRLVHRDRVRLEPQPAERALLFGHGVAQHRLAVAYTPQ